MQYPEAAHAAFRRARERWPRIALSSDQFLARAAVLGVTPTALESHCDDLFLAFGCLESEPGALRSFEANYLSQVDLHVRRFGLPPHLMDEVRQRVRVKLLVGGTPGIARYAGHGPLMAFVRVTAIRVAVDTAASAGAGIGTSAEEVLESYASFVEAPELTAIKNTYRDRFCAQLEASISALDPAEKTLLRLHVVDRLNIDAIGVIYRTHRATIARRLVRIRAKVLDDFQNQFAIRWGVSSSDVRSLVRLLRDEIHVSVQRVLASAAK
jgi:RNA polymerase sigma-70 factor (ECF subfamily)